MSPRDVEGAIASACTGQGLGGGIGSGEDYTVMWSPEHSGSFLKEGNPELALEEWVVRG